MSEAPSKCITFVRDMTLRLSGRFGKAAAGGDDTGSAWADSVDVEMSMAVCPASFAARRNTGPILCQMTAYVSPRRSSIAAVFIRAPLSFLSSAVSRRTSLKG